MALSQYIVAGHIEFDNLKRSNISIPRKVKGETIRLENTFTKPNYQSLLLVLIADSGPHIVSLTSISSLPATVKRPNISIKATKTHIRAERIVQCKQFGMLENTFYEF